MNKVTGSRGVRRGWGLCLGVGILLCVVVDCMSLNQNDEREHSTFIHAVRKLIKDLNDAANPDLHNTVTSIIRDLKTALDHTQLSSRVNWFMKCIDNCLHLHDDKHIDTGNGHPYIDEIYIDAGDDNERPFGLPSNVSVEVLYDCNHNCVNAATGNPGVIGR